MVTSTCYTWTLQVTLAVRRELVIQQILESKSLEYIPYEQPSTLDLDSSCI